MQLTALIRQFMSNTINGSDSDSVPLPFPKALSRVIRRITTSIKKRFSTGKRRGATRKDHTSPLRNIYNYLGKRPFWGYHVFFLMLVTVIGASNAFAKANLMQEVLYNPNTFPIKTKAEFTANVGHYTPVVQEDPTAMVLASAVEETSGYYSEPLLTETKMTERPKPEEPQEDLRNRSKSTIYTVQPGDTLNRIGWKYGLKVATIQYQNKLKGETIAPGQKLTLPPADISSSLIAQANQNQRAIADSRVSSSQPDPGDGGYVQPINWSYISRRLGGGHSGTDMCAPSGTAVVAARSGTVVGASYGWNGGYGNIISINHGGSTTRYAHLSSIGVSAGQQVGAGQYIGASGSTGRSTGPHLHFEAIVGGRFTAPF